MWRCKFEAEVSKCERPSKETCLEYPWKWICWASLGLLSSGIAGVHVLIWHFSNEHGSTIVLFVSCTTSWRVWNDVRELYSLCTLQDQCFQKHVQKFALVTRKKKQTQARKRQGFFTRFTERSKAPQGPYLLSIFTLCESLCTISCPACCLSMCRAMDICSRWSKFSTNFTSHSIIHTQHIGTPRSQKMLKCFPKAVRVSSCHTSRPCSLSTRFWKPQVKYSACACLGALLSWSWDF